MRMRIFLYKPAETVREELVHYIESLGHDVAIVHSPQACLHYHSEKNTCTRTESCADVFILGQDMPVNAGLDLVERRLAAGCQGAVHSALIGFDLTEAERLRAEKIGCRYFREPLRLDEIGSWLEEVQRRIPDGRLLSPFTIGGNGEEKSVEGL